ncbi:dentin sialophosphoproteinsialophosphoprotein-like, -like [Octopus vulgaris]|nr:dentin sialophosphoproteinsialophosphoprotein-like, -like [Octopus vulgaris]
MAKIKGPYSLRRSNQSSLELMMECEEDDLSPWQIEASRRALDDYEKAVQRIKAAKARQMIQQKASSVTTPASLPRSKSPDVIIVGETPATRVPNQVQQSRMGSTQLLKSQLHANQLQRSSLSNSMLTANTLNKNLAGNMSLGKVQGQMRKPGENSSLSQQHSLILPKAISSLLSAANHRQVGSGNNSNNNNNNSLSQSEQGTTSANTIGYGFKKTDPLDTASTTLKRSADTDSAQSPPKKKVQRKTSTDSSAGNWVPLDEYYYGKMEGDPNYWEEKGEHRFKCWYCSKMLYNNVRTMMHMQGHIDSEKQQNLDLSDLTQCKHCYKQFDTPFEMQTHIEKVHMNNANVLLCRICEKDHDSRLALTNHMRQVHTACEMPYICQMCNFRSSMYSDAVDHFKKKHDSSPFILCLYCLKIFRVKFVANGWGQTQMYYHHLLKHQSKTNSRKCPICKLTFFNSLEVKAHRKKDHQSNQKGVIGMNAKYTTPDQVMIKVPEPGVAPTKDKGVKSLNAPALTKVMDYHGMRLPEYMETYKCIECKANMNTAGHFRKYIECSMCRFATSCSTAYATHMLGFHSGRLTNFSISIPTEKPMDEPMYCLCGFGSRLGNKIANHMVYCIKKTCYTQKPDVDWVEVDDVDEESNYDDPCRRPGASILDVLGLVKKQTLLPGIYRRCGPPTYPQSTMILGAAPAKSTDSDTKPSTQKLEEDSNSSAATNESAGPKDSDQSQNAQKQEVPKDTQSTQTPTEAAAESDVDAEFSNWRKVCCEEFELEAENIEKLINRDIAEEWTAEEWEKLQKDCATYGFWFAITDYIYSCEDYTFVKILPRIFENLFLDPPENISNFLSRIRRRLKRGGVDWIKETFLEPQKNLGPLCDKLGITVELLQKGESPNVPASQLSKALALELLYYKKRHPTMSYADLAGWIKLIFNFPTLPDQRDLHFQLEGIHRLKNKLRGHKTEVVKMLKEPFEPVFTSSDIDVETDGAATTGSSDDATGGAASCSTAGTGSDSNLTVPATTREEEEEEEEEDLEEEEDAEEEEELEEEEEEEEEEDFFVERNQDGKCRVSSSDNPPEGSSDDSCSVPTLEKKRAESPRSAKDTMPQDDENTNISEPSKTRFDKEDSVDSVKLHDSTASESDHKPAGHVRADKLAEDSKSSCDTAASETTLTSQTRKRNHSETDTESSEEKQKGPTNLDPVTKKLCPQQTENAKSEAPAGLKSGTDAKEAKKPITDQGIDSHSKQSVKSSLFDDATTADLTKGSVGIGEKGEKKGEVKVTSGTAESPLSSKEKPQEKGKTTEAVTKDTKTAAGESDSGKTDRVKKAPEVEGRKSKSAEKLQEVCEKLRAARGGGGGGSGSDVDLSVGRKGKKDEDEKVVPDKKKAEPEAGASSKREADCSKASEPSKELPADDSGKKSLQKAEPKQKSSDLKAKPADNVPDSKSKVENSSDPVKPSLKASTVTAESKSVENQSKEEGKKSLSKPCDDSTRTSQLNQGPTTPKQPLKEDTEKSSDKAVLKSVPDKISKSADSKSSGDSLKVSIPKADASKSGKDSSASGQSTVTGKSEPKKESNKMSDVQTDSADKKKNLSSKTKLDTETTKVESVKTEKPKDSVRGEGTAKDEVASKLPGKGTGVTKEEGSRGVKSTEEDLKSKVTSDPKVVDKAKNDQTGAKKMSTEPQKLKDSGISKMGSSLKPGADKPSDSKAEGILAKADSSKGLSKASEKKNNESGDQSRGSSKEGTPLKPVSGESSSVGAEKPSSDLKKESAKSDAATKKPVSAEDGEKKSEKTNAVPESSKTPFSVKSKESTKDVSKAELKESSSASVSSKTADDGSTGTKKPVAEQPTAGEISSKSKEGPSKLASRESVLAEAGSMQDKTLTKLTTTLIKESSPSEKSIIKPTESASKISSGSQSKPSPEAPAKSAVEESLPKSTSLSKKELSEPNQKPSSEAQASSLSKSPAKSSSEASAKSSLKVPTKTSLEAPAKTSSEAPTKTSSEAPAKTSSKAPAKTSSEALAKTSSEAPAKTSSEAPAKSSSKVPTKPLSEDSAKSPSETSVKKSSSETPAKSSSETPAKSLSDAPTKSSSETPSKTSSEAKSSSEPQSTNTPPTQTKPAANSNSSNNSSTAADPNKTAKPAEDSSSKQKKDVHLPKSQSGATTTTAATKVGAAQDIKKEGDNKVTVIKMASATSHSNVDCSSGKSTPKSVVSHSAEAKRDSLKSADTSRSKTTSRAVAEESRSAKHEGQTSVITPTKKVEVRGFSASTPAESPGAPDKTTTPSSVSSSSPSLSSSSSQQQHQQKKMSSSGGGHDDGRRESSGSGGHSYDSRPYQKSRPEMSRDHSQHHRDRSMYDSDYRSQAASDRLYHPRDDFGDRKYSSGYDNRNAHSQRGSNQYGGPGPDYRGPNPGQYGGSRDYRGPKSYDQRNRGGGGGGGPPNRGFDPNWRNNRGGRGNYGGNSGYRGGYRSNYY